MQIIHQKYTGLYFSDWKKWVKSKIAILQFTEAFKYYNLPIKTFGEFAWFMNFSTKWDLVNRDILRHIGKQENYTINFYDTQDFQNWSMSNFDKLHMYDQNNSKYYKLELKQFCNKIFPDTDYLKYKGKVDSTTYAFRVNSAQPTKDIFAVIIEDNDIIKLEYQSNMYNNEKQIVGDSLLRRALVKYRNP